VDKSRQLSQLLQELIRQLAPGHDIVSQVLAVAERATDCAVRHRSDTPETPPDESSTAAK